MNLSHRDLCILATAWLLKQSWCDIACFEIKYNRGFVDAVGISKPRAKKPRVTVIEVKKTRADLLADINSKKYLKYEPGSTHCYLAGTREALMLHKRSVKEVIADLKNRGFPDHWGILVFGPRGGITTLRKTQAHRKTTRVRTQALTRKIAKSLIYRAIQGKV